jgi:hypothetical protein
MLGAPDCIPAKYRKGLYVFLCGVMNFVRYNSSYHLEWSEIVKSFSGTHTLTVGHAECLWDSLVTNRSDADYPDPKSLDCNTLNVDPFFFPCPKQLAIIILHLKPSIKEALASLESSFQLETKRSVSTKLWHRYTKDPVYSVLNLNCGSEILRSTAKRVKTLSPQNDCKNLDNCSSSQQAQSDAELSTSDTLFASSTPLNKITSPSDSRSARYKALRSPRDEHDPWMTLSPSQPVALTPKSFSALSGIRLGEPATPCRFFGDTASEPASSPRDGEVAKVILHSSTAMGDPADPAADTAATELDAA